MALFDIAVCSLFRDSQLWHKRAINQVERFFAQLDEQEREVGQRLHYFVLEGDSQDNTFEALREQINRRPEQITLIKYDLGGRPPCSDGQTDRHKVLAQVGNVCLRSALEANTELIFWLESDLLISTGLLKGLLEATTQLDWHRVLAVAPLPVIRQFDRDMFYDGWAFEGLDGRRWDKIGVWDGKAVEEFRKYRYRYRQMHTIGSCALLNAKLLRQHQIDFDTGCFPALCRAGVNIGLEVYCDTTLEVVHPSEDNIKGRWV